LLRFFSADVNADTIGGGRENTRVKVKAKLSRYSHADDKGKGSITPAHY
jgi:hypothetical protein